MSNVKNKTYTATKVTDVVNCYLSIDNYGVDTSQTPVGYSIASNTQGSFKEQGVLHSDADSGISQEVVQDAEGIVFLF